MKKILFVLPLTVLLFAVSCSEEKKAIEKEETTVKEKDTRPLLEREPEVKDYLESTNEIIEEYLTVAETALTTMEKLDAGTLGLLESASTVQELLVSWTKIDNLSKGLDEQDNLKETIENKLNSDDLLEFTLMYSETIQRVDSLRQRIESSDLTKYMDVGSW